MRGTTQRRPRRSRWAAGHSNWVIALLGVCGAVALPPALWADGGAAHRAAQGTPIELGTSGGSINLHSSAFCCGGTLGSLVQNANGMYILSNNHILARTNKGSLGEAAIQPGLIDQSPVCDKDANDTVAHLSDYVQIRFAKGRSVPLNEVDAAIAQVVPNAVRTDGSIIDIGVLSASTVAPSLGQVVQKSGRTTGRTFGVVAAVDVTLDVGYSKDCGSSAIDVARFVNQFLITDGSFSAGGDSGSLIVEADGVDPTDGLPRATGLLFAGGSSYTVANPIDRVLALLGVTMASGAPAAPPVVGWIEGLVTSAADDSAIAGATVSTDTGQSATTAANGTYVIIDVPTGTRTVSASASGYDAQQQAAVVDEGAGTVADFALVETVVPTGASVDCVTYTTQGGKNGDKHLNISLSVVDEFGAPVSGVEVQIAVTLDGAPWGTGTGAITSSTGVAAYTAKNAPYGEFVTTVTAILGGPAFDGSTPANSFDKGTDPTPDADCRAGASGSDSAGGPGNSGSALAHASAVKASHEAGLFSHAGVVGTGISRNGAGRPVIEVYLDRERPETRAAIPAALDGVATRVMVTGPFLAF